MSEKWAQGEFLQFFLPSSDEAAVSRQLSLPKTCVCCFGTEFGEGDATKQKSVKRSAFPLNEGKAFSE